LQITITRSLQGKKLSFKDEQINKTIGTIEFSIIDSVFNELQFDIPIFDKIFVSVYLISRRIYGFEDNFNLITNKDLYFLSDEMLRFLFVHTNLDFSYDQEVRQLLSRELKSLLIRLENQIELRNLPIIEIKQENSAFEYALIMIDYISKKYNLIVPEEEAIPLALILQKSLLNDYRNFEKLKVGLVFYKGKNYCYLIENKLYKHFKNHIQKIELLEYYELCPSYEDQYDLIITDLPITRFNINIPIFQVQNQLNEYERKKLSQFFTRKNLKLGWFLEALNENLFLSDCNATTKEELIELVSNLFIKNVKVSDQIFDLFTYRETLSVSEHGNNCALIHTMYQCSEKTQIAFIKLKKPIIWHNESVQLVFFIANGNEERLYNFIDWLRQMLTQMNLVHELLKCKEYSEVSEVFINVFHKLDLN